MNDLRLIALMHANGVGRHWDRPTTWDWAGVLATFPLFAGASNRRLRNLARKATLAEFTPGETIISAGDTDEVLYVILSGRTKATAPGVRRVLGTGDYFGEMALIDGRPRSATVVALSDVHVMRLPSRSILKLARRHPAMTLALLRDLTTRLRQLEAQGAQAA